MSAYANDGTPLHGAIRNSTLQGKYPPFAMVGLMEGVVLQAFYKDDVGNKSKKYTEYTILEVSRGQKFPYARLVNVISGIANGAETTIAETTSVASNSAGSLVVEGGAVAIKGASDPSLKSRLAPTPSYLMNGERVVFTCLGGDLSAPVILGTLPHPQVEYSTERKDTPRDFKVFGDWTYEINKKNQLRFERKDGLRITLTTDGDVEVVPKSGKTVRLGAGVGSANEALVLGDTYRGAESSMNADLIKAIGEASAELIAAGQLGTWAAAKTLVGKAGTGLADAVAAITSFEGKSGMFLSTVSKTK